MSTLRFRLTVALATLLTATTAAVAQDRVHERIDSLVRAEMQRQRIPGVAVAVVKDGQVLSAKG